MADNHKHFPSLKELAIRGAMWVAIGYGISQLLRLVSNLVLTRLLAPEHFGVMAIVNVFMIGLAMFSDVGIGPSIIQNERGTDRKFLNTAWTIQVIRGLAIWLICLLGAWPLSLFYGEPLLLWLVPVAGLTSVISGFNSSGIFSFNRKLFLGRLTAIEIVSQLVAIAAMFIIALAHSSVWVLVYGALISAFVKMICTHIWLTDELDRLCWDRNAVNALIRFGRWIFVSTVLSFFLNSAGSLILGKFMSMSELGLFTIAATLSKVIEQIYQQISNKIIFPVYAQIKHLPLADIRERVNKIRLAVMITFLPPLWSMVIFGQAIIDLFFDSRYHGAGWIFSVFTAGFIPIVIAGIGPFYLAMGDSLTLMKTTLIKFIFYIFSLVIGWRLFGAEGIICGMAASNALTYFFEIYLQKKYGIWILRLDVIGIISSFSVLGLGFYLQ